MEESIAILCIRLLVTEDPDEVRKTGEQLRKAIRESVGRVRQNVARAGQAATTRLESRIASGD